MDMPSLVCFDWDGTLLDTQENITRACMAAAQELGLPPVSEQKILSLVGVHVEAFFAELFGDEIAFDVLLETYHKHYYKLPIAPFFPGVEKLLQFLKEAGIDVAIVTNKSRQSLEYEMEAKQIEHLVDSIWVAEEHAAKPSPIMIVMAQSTHQAKPEATWMVGDALPDMYAGDRSGCGKILIVNQITVPNWMDRVEIIPSIASLETLIASNQL